MATFVTGNGTIPSFGERLIDTEYALLPFKRWELLVFLVWIPLMLVLGRFVFEILLKIQMGRTFSLSHHLVDLDNKAAGISYAGFLFATGLATYGALSDHSSTSSTTLWTSIVWSLIGLFLINLSEFINDRLLHFKINYKEEVFNNQNVAISLVHASVYIASGIITRFTISGDVNDWGEALLSTIILWATSQIFFILFVHLYDLITPGVDIQAELLEGNNAVGFSVGGGILAFAIFIKGPIAKSESVVALAIWCVLGLIAFLPLKFISNRILIFNHLLVTAKDLPNWAASAVESAFLMTFAMAASNFTQQFRCGVDPRAWGTRIVDIAFSLAIFEWYNIIFLACILLIAFVARIIYQAHDMYIAAAAKSNLWSVFVRFLRVRRRDQAQEMSEQIEGNPYLRQRCAAQVQEVERDEANEDAPGDAEEQGMGAREQSTLTLMDGGNGLQLYSVTRCLGFAGYLIGIAFVMRGALGAAVDPALRVGEVVGYFFLWNSIGLICLAASFFVVRYILWRHLIEDSRENDAVGILTFGGYVASGMIIGSCLGGMRFSDGTANATQTDFEWGEDIATVAIFFSIGQFLLVLTGVIFQVITPFNDIEEVKKQNLAVGASACMNWIAFGICASAPVQYNDSLLNVFLFYIVAVCLLQLLRFLTSLVLIGGHRLNDELALDRNWGAALIEGACAITTALCLTTFMADSCALKGVVSVGYG